MRGGRTLPVIPLLTGLMLLAWPFLIGFGLAHNSLQWLLPVMALVLLLRLRQAQRNTSPMRYVVQCVALAALHQPGRHNVSEICVYDRASLLETRAAKAAGH